MLKKAAADDSIIFDIKHIVEENKTGGFDYDNINGKLEEFNKGRFDDSRSNLKRPVSEFSSAGSSRGRKFIRKKPRFLLR